MGPEMYSILFLDCFEENIALLSEYKVEILHKYCCIRVDGRVHCTLHGSSISGIGSYSFLGNVQILHSQETVKLVKSVFDI